MIAIGEMESWLNTPYGVRYYIICCIRLINLFCQLLIILFQLDCLSTVLTLISDLIGCWYGP